MLFIPKSGNLVVSYSFVHQIRISSGSAARCFREESCKEFPQIRSEARNKSNMKHNNNEINETNSILS